MSWTRLAAGCCLERGKAPTTMTGIALAEDDLPSHDRKLSAFAAYSYTKAETRSRISATYVAN
jgi:hypothetical protein